MNKSLDLPDESFLPLARQAFDVMMRRGWSPKQHDDEDQSRRWFVGGTSPSNAWGVGPDPFTALVEADAWYRANIEGHTP